MDIENQPNTDQQDSAATEAAASEMEGTPAEGTPAEGTPAEDTRVEDKVMVVNEEGRTPDEGEEAAEKEPMLSPPPEYDLAVGYQAAEVQKEGATKQNGVHPTGNYIGYQLVYIVYT